MLDGKTVAVVVPCYNEETQILSVLETMPEFVDRIVVVDDKSSDNTFNVVKQYIDSSNPSKLVIQDLLSQEVKRNRFNNADVVLGEIRRSEQEKYIPQEVYNSSQDTDRVILIRHIQNGSVGAAIASGYKWCRDRGIDCTAVMAGDGQMDPSELEDICRPIIDNSDIDYVKGNRLSHRSAFFVIPKVRYFGNSILSLLTKIASGYWRVSDTQTGYTAISLSALNAIRLYDIYKSYGCPNDILVKLNIAFCTIKEIPIKPVYKVGEQSKMKLGKVIPRISYLLFKCFWRRLYVKYLFRDFHPLFLLYHLSFLLLLLDIPFFIEVVQSISPSVTLSMQSLIIFVFLTTAGLQSLFFAMWMDMMDNDRLQVT
jgi:glycosyltransferase involved in cell wall biosynthesis